MMAWTSQVKGQISYTTFTMPSFYKTKSDTSPIYTECFNSSNKVFWYYRKPIGYFEDSCVVCHDVNKGKTIAEYLKVERGTWLMVRHSRKGKLKEVGYLKTSGDTIKEIESFAFEGEYGELIAVKLNAYELVRSGTWFIFDRRGKAILKQY